MDDQPIKVAYVDPPYIGRARKRYRCPEVDHRALVAQLVECFPDGWALSLASDTLQEVLSFCPGDVRIGVWVKPWSVVGRYMPRVVDCWEPVIFAGGRARKGPHIRNVIEMHAPNRGSGFIGRKPPEFSRWTFEMLGLLPGDELVDLFIGSGAVSREWLAYAAQGQLSVESMEAPKC